jgi:hypothetical protein
VNRDAKTPSALLALARHRRVQRALAHAYLHKGSPMPTLASSLGYMTATACTTDDAADDAWGHRMKCLGVSRRDGTAVIVEEIAPDEAPIVYRLYLRGPRMGHLVPLRAWYAHGASPRMIREKIAHLAPTLEPVARATKEAWMLSTRVIHRRALRTPNAAPIRSFALQLSVEPVASIGPSGRTTVTAVLRPGAQLAEVWAISGADAAIARVSYTGIPTGVGAQKDTVILLTSGLFGVDEQ